MIADDLVLVSVDDHVIDATAHWHPMATTGA